MAEETVKSQLVEFITDESGKKILRTQDDVRNQITENSKVTETTKEVLPQPIQDVCSVKPVEAFMSTNLNNKTKTFDDMSERILHMLGYPAVSITDIHRDQIYEAISIACEMYTRYAGYTLENLIFDSNIYEPNKGIRLDQLYTISAVWDAVHEKGQHLRSAYKNFDQVQKEADDVYVTKVPIPASDYYISADDFELLMAHCKEADKDILCYLKDVSRRYPNGIEELSIISDKFYRFLIERRNYNQSQFKKSKDKVVTMAGEELNIYGNHVATDEKGRDKGLGKVRDTLFYNNAYDYDLMDYRKVISIHDYHEGSSTTMSSLFSFEAAIATQTYFSYQFSLRGFDLVSMSALGEFRKTRDRVLATQRDWDFNEYTQYFRLTPQPRYGRQRFFGVIEAYVERPLRDIIKSPWVFKYALALVKEMMRKI